MKHLFFCFCLFFSTALTAQNIRVLAVRVTEPDGTPLPGVSLIVDDTVRAVTDASGVYALRPKHTPKVLVLRCVGYFPQRVLLDTVPVVKGLAQVDVRMQSQWMDIPEVTVGARRTEQLFEENFQTDLLDFVFAGDYLVLLLRDRKRYLLQLTDDRGQVQSELSLPLPADRLHQSCTGDFHAVGEQWSWEFTLTGSGIDTFPRYPSAEFHRLVEPCVVRIREHYFFQSMGPFRQSVRYRYFVAGDPQPHLFAEVRDEVTERLLMGYYREILFNYMKTIPDVDRDDILDGRTPFTDPMQALNPDMLTKMAETNELLAAIGFFSQVARDSVYAPLVCLGDTLFLLDHVNDKLIRVQVPEWTDVVLPLNYHRENGWRKMLITDVPKARMYGLFSTKSGDVVFKELNLQTGLAGKAYNIVDAPYLSDHFRLRNGWLYCIGQDDVNSPNRKLYKMNLYAFQISH